MSDSESHEMEEQTIIYEEEEVLWAKIRGYPWWPAFVDKVHGAKSSQDEEIQYTVFFFGDNTHSRLGGSKLRRFLDYYTEFFPKAKTNRKLYLSIMKAEEKLKQNGGNVQIFESLRNSIKKPKKPKAHHVTQSKISSEDHPHNLSEQPQLIRNRTFLHKQQKQKQCSQINFPDEPLHSEKPKRRGRKTKRLTHQQKYQSEKMEPDSEHSLQDQQPEKQQSLDQPKVLGYRTRSGRNKKQITEKIEQKEQQKFQEEQKVSSDQSEQQSPAKKTYPLRFTNKNKPISRAAPKKRGRPKKVIEEINPSSSEQNHDEEPSQNSEQNNLIPQLSAFQSSTEGRKLRHQRHNSSRVALQNKQPEKHPVQEVQQKFESSQQNKELVMQRVKFCLDKRAELIQYLDELNITIDIIKDILDLNVTTIILEGGDTTVESIRVLQKLKSALLHKYFPEDIKIRKKYEKLSKKTQSLKTSTPQNEESLQDLQLRRKTLVKLQKILRTLGQEGDPKEKAIEIESNFRKYDESIGTGYKTIAYKVLRSLKDRSFSVDEVVARMQSGQFDEDEK